MNDDQAARVRQWVECWRVAGAKLEELRQQELREVDTQKALMNLADAFESCRLHFRPAPTSGLVIQQAVFQRLRK